MAVKETSIGVIAENKIGLFAEIASAMTEKNVNIKAICGYIQDGKAHCYMLTSNNAGAIEALKARGFDVEGKEVVAVLAENKVGEAGKIAGKIKNAGIDLDFLYGTTCAGDVECMMVMSSDDNDKLADVLNS